MIVLFASVSESASSPESFSSSFSVSVSVSVSIMDAGSTLSSRLSLMMIDCKSFFTRALASSALNFFNSPQCKEKFFMVGRMGGRRTADGGQKEM